MKKRCIVIIFIVCLPLFVLACSKNKIEENKIEDSDIVENKGSGIVMNAKDAVLTGNLKIEKSKQGYNGDGYIVGLEEEEDIITFIVNIEKSDHYDLNFVSASFDNYKENNVLVDDNFVGIISVERTEFQDSRLNRIYLDKGEHKIMVTKSWGWIYLDRLEVTSSEASDMSFYDVDSKLVDQLATDSTKRLMRYIDDSYGKYTLSGQFSDKGINGPEIKAIESVENKKPAILGLDFIEYTPSRVANGSTSKAVEYAILNYTL